MSHHAPRLRAGRRRRVLIALVAVAGVAGVVAGSGMLKGFLPHPVVADGAPGRETDDRPVTVKAVRPKRDSSFRVTNQQLASVEAYYEAGLRARASGIVKEVPRDIGEPVHAGDLLVVIDAPDLEQAVAQKDAVILQRLREVDGAAADLESARAGVEVGRAAVRQKDAEVTQAQNVLAFKTKYLDRVTVLVAGGSVTPDRREEAELDAKAAAAGVESAKAAVARAAADLTERQASEKKAAADLDIKRALVEVARRDRGVAAAQLGFARLRSPFDGVVAKRIVDPGVFVQNASTGASEPLLTVARTDLVTVVMRLPDAAAAYLGPHTEAEVAFDQLPGVVVRGPVSRFSPIINPTDRMVRVEVDVYNGSADDYQRFVARQLSRTTLPLLSPGLGGLAAAGAGHMSDLSAFKGGGWGSVLVPDWAGAPPTARVVPGMTGTMRVALDNIAGAYLVPSTAVFTRGGVPAVMLVEDGRTRVAPVTVQVNDGRVARVRAAATSA